MQRETAFAGGVVAVVVVMLLSAALVPGVIAERDDEPDVRASHLRIMSDAGTMSIAEVPGHTVTLRMDTRLRHRGGPAENVTVEVRAIDTDTGLLATSERKRLGTIRGDREVPVVTNLTVPREGGYRIETIVYENGTREAYGERSISGAEAIQPVQFHRFETTDGTTGVVPREPRQLDDGRVALNVSSFLTNTGSTDADDLTLLVRARQADSGLIADESRRTIGDVRSGRTNQANVRLTVPGGYNYWLDAVLFKDGVIIDSATGVAALDPPMNASESTTGDGAQLDVSDFESSDSSGEPEPTGDAEEDTPMYTEGGGPGFGLAAALVGLLAAALLIARNHD